jgi:cytosine/adenosine deaminase-related metal-dependent hydrolase
MFCACCRVPGQRSSGFFAEDVGAPAPDAEAALARRAVYQRRATFSSAPALRPEQTEFIIRQACLLTMDPFIGDLANGDVHVRDGVIVNIGRDLQATAMHEIDGRNAIALPGFIASHRHLCTSAFAEIDHRQLPDLSSAHASDIYKTMRLALLDALAAGITTLNHCAYDIGSEHAETAIVAQIDSGVRGCLSYPLGGPTWDGTPDHDTLRRLEREWFASYGDHLLDLGLAVDNADDDTLAIPPSLPITADHTKEVTQQQDSLAARTLDAARALSLDHCIGSLSPGKCADIILIAAPRGDGTPLAPQQGHEIIRNATAADVLLVAIDGRLRKQNGVLTEPNEGLIRREGRDAVGRLRAEAHWPSIAN